MLLLLIFCNVIIILCVLSYNIINVKSEEENWKVIGNSSLTDLYMEELIYEGLTNDGINFIVNSKNNIYLINSTTYKIIFHCNDCIPIELRKLGYDHLGDTQYYNKQLYIAVEEKSYSKPAFFIYDLINNNFIFNQYKSQSIQSHMPWLAINNNYIYSSEYDNVNEILLYNLNNFEFSHKLILNETLQNVQGGAFYNDYLYVGCNSGDTIYRININNGETEVTLQITEAHSSQEYEMEGLTFLDLRESHSGLMHSTGNYWTQLRNTGTMVHADFI